MLLAAHDLGDVEGALVADLGCGGGVLGIGASMLGAAAVIGVDVDGEATTLAASLVGVVALGWPFGSPRCGTLKYYIIQ